MLEEQLKKFGLSEKEAKTYITLLVLGESTAAAVAEESGVKRSSAYVVLEALQKKGLVKGSENEKIQRFKAAPPEKLAEIAEENLKKQKDIHRTVQEMLPELKGVDFDNKFSPKVSVFEGIKDIERIYNDVFESNFKGTLRTFSSPDTALEVMGEYFAQHREKRAELKIPIKTVHPDTRLSRELVKNDKGVYSQRILVKEKNYNLETDFAIYGDKVAFVSPRDSFGIIIQNKKIADTLKNVYDIFFEEVKIEQKQKN